MALSVSALCLYISEVTIYISEVTLKFSMSVSALCLYISEVTIYIGSDFDISKFMHMHMHANDFSYNRTDRQSVCCKNKTSL